MNEVQAKGGIDDINARHNTKMEGFMTRMSYMEKLFEIGWCSGKREGSK